VYRNNEQERRVRAEMMLERFRATKPPRKVVPRSKTRDNISASPVNGAALGNTEQHPR